MSKRDKLLEKLITKPRNFTFDELKKLLNGLDFKLDEKGKSSGSRIAFYNQQSRKIIMLHRPHPNKELKKYQIDIVIKVLKEIGVIKWKT